MLSGRCRLKHLSSLFVTQNFVLLSIKQSAISVDPAFDVVPTGQFFVISLVSSVLDIWQYFPAAHACFDELPRGQNSFFWSHGPHS